MRNTSFERLKAAIKRKEEEQYVKLKEEIIKLRDNIEYYLTLFFESTSSQAKTNYSGLEMY